MRHLIAITAALAGCTSLPADPTKMTPEQLTAAAKDRSISAICVLASTPWGPQRSVNVTLDKASIASGTVTMTPDCQVTIQADPKAKP